MADFSTQVSEWVLKARGNADAALRAIAFDAVTRVQELTPVDTGFLRSNWTAIKQGDEEPVAGRVRPPGAAIAAAHAGDTIIILNPVVYARRIEYGFIGEDSAGKTYNQQGRHMVAQTVSEMPQIAARAVARINGGG